MPCGIVSEIVHGTDFRDLLSLKGDLLTADGERDALSVKLSEDSAKQLYAVNGSIQLDLDLTALHSGKMLRSCKSSLNTGGGYLQSVCALNGISLIKHGINSSVELFAIVDADAAFLIDSQTKDHLSTFSDKFHIPQHYILLLCHRSYKLSHKGSDSAGPFFLFHTSPFRKTKSGRNPLSLILIFYIQYTTLSPKMQYLFQKMFFIRIMSAQCGINNVCNKFTAGYSIPEERVIMEDLQNNNSGTPEGDQFEYIMKSGGVISKGDGQTIHCLTIIGQIEGHYILGDGQKATKYEHIIPLLVSIEEDPGIDGMLMVLNTMGGDVEAGLAIAEMVAGMTKPTVSLVLGGGHSIGVPLAVSAKRSFIVPSATMTIHPVRMSGTVVGTPQTYYYFERMQDRIVNFIVKHSNVSEENFRKMLLRTDQIATDTGTLIDGIEATGCGLIDEVGSLADALAALRGMIGEKEGKPAPKKQTKSGKTSTAK